MGAGAQELMTQRQFKCLVRIVRRGWTRSRGLVVLLSRRGGGVLRLCAPGSQETMLPETCLLWDGDALVLEGPLDSIRLQKALTARKVIGYAVRTFRALSSLDGLKFRPVPETDA